MTLHKDKQFGQRLLCWLRGEHSSRIDTHVPGRARHVPTEVGVRRDAKYAPQDLVHGHTQVCPHGVAVVVLTWRIGVVIFTWRSYYVFEGLIKQSSYISSSISDMRHLETSAVESHLRYL